MPMHPYPIDASAATQSVVSPLTASTSSLWDRADMAEQEVATTAKDGESRESRYTQDRRLCRLHIPQVYGRMVRATRGT